ncbi:MAG: GatB/YqeY domain-containing protein [Verrucomicrobiaceae bacterium]|nr:GatB/YqeY domain-containing protein [Verrucomicrobiaceae bacterium]
MSLADQIMSDLKEAMRAKDSTSLTVLRSLKTALTNLTIEKHGAGGELDNNTEIGVVRTAIKQRNDSIEQFEKAGRQDLADNEKAEIDILNKYLPATLSEEETAQLIDEAITESGATSRKEMGQVMKILQEKAAGRVDNKTLSAGVMQRLG